MSVSKFNVEKKYLVYSACVDTQKNCKLPEEPETKDDDTDYYYLTNTKIKNTENSAWKIKNIELNGTSSRLKLKDIKINTNKYFSNYSVSIWHDDNMKLTQSAKEIVKGMENEELGVFNHYTGTDCLYKEIERYETIFSEENNQELLNQAVDQFNDGWYKENIEFSTRDEISLPYVVKEKKLSIYKFKGHIIEGNPYVKYDGSKKEKEIMDAINENDIRKVFGLLNKALGRSILVNIKKKLEQ
eukprot:gene4786-8372_t